MRLAKNNVKLNATLASRKDIRVEFDHAEPSLVIMVDEAKMEQVLNNLISNAVKFSSPGSSVRVRVEKAGSKALVSVEDQGQGIPAGEWDSLFRPFQKTSVRSTGGEERYRVGFGHCVQDSPRT